MKLVRYGERGKERPGLVDSTGAIRSLSGVVDDVAGETLSEESLERLSHLDPTTLALVPPDVRLGPCVAGTSKILCIGLNYADHAREAGMEIPQEPVIFMKATTAICGPNDDVEIPPGSQKTDWEVELAIVIGTRAKYVEPAAGLKYVAGYCICNDLSEREFQLERCGQWVKGKSCDTFAPLGPWLVTKDEIRNVQDLPMWLEVDGRRYQDGSTRTMVFGVAELVSYVSQFMTLLPGDVISTGTPPGVGLGLKPPKYLQAGQVMRLGIEGLGIQQQRTVNAS